jgi:hypothetical protein
MNKRVNVREFRLLIPHCTNFRLSLDRRCIVLAEPSRPWTIAREKCRPSAVAKRAQLDRYGGVRAPARARTRTGVLIPGIRDIKMVRRQQHGRSNWIPPTIAGRLGLAGRVRRLGNCARAARMAISRRAVGNAPCDRLPRQAVGSAPSRATCNEDQWNNS